MARIFRFVDILGSELHRINDPENKLPIPEIRQVISIGQSRMRVESVTLERNALSASSVYYVRVRAAPAVHDD